MCKFVSHLAWKAITAITCEMKWRGLIRTRTSISAGQLRRCLQVIGLLISRGRWSFTLITTKLENRHDRRHRNCHRRQSGSRRRSGTIWNSKLNATKCCWTKKPTCCNLDLSLVACRATCRPKCVYWPINTFWRRILSPRGSRRANYACFTIFSKYIACRGLGPARPLKKMDAAPNKKGVI